jgi:hypothetical protein
VTFLLDLTSLQRLDKIHMAQKIPLLYEKIVKPMKRQNPNASDSLTDTRYFQPFYLCFSYIVLSLLTFLIFSCAIIIHGTTGVCLDLSQKGLYVSSVNDPGSPLKRGDFIQQVNGIGYEKMLHLFAPYPFSNPETYKITIIRDNEKLALILKNKPLSLFDFTTSAFFFLLAIFILSGLSLAALFRAPPGQPSHIFLSSMISFSLATTADLPLFFGVIQPGFVSWYYILTLISGWLAFSSWAHFVLRYPRERDLLLGRPILIGAIYLVLPAVSCLLAWFPADSSSAFFSQLCRLRNWAVPIIIPGTFFKHVFDVVTSKEPSIKDQIVLPLITAVFGISPYLFLYALPGLMMDRPFISSNIVTLLAMSVPLSLFFSLIRHRLFDVDEIISKIISYTALILFLSLTYSLFIAGLKRWFFGRAILSEELFLLFIIGTALFFQPIRSRLESLINRLFNRQRQIPAKALHAFSEKITTSLRQSDLLQTLVDKLPEQMDISGAAILLMAEKQSLIYPENLDFENYIWPESRLYSIFREKEQPYLATDIIAKDKDLNHELNLLRKKGFNLVFPLTWTSQNQKGFRNS